MPKIDAVGALAEPHERRQGEGARHEALGLHTRGDHAEREHRAEERAATVLERVVAVGEEHHGHEAHKADDAHEVD